MIKPLDHWSLHRTIPTIDDSEALSVLELVGKNTTKINELVSDYNKFVDDVNKVINEFTTNTNTSQEEFEASINKIVHDYIKMLDEKIKAQDLEIENAVKYMKDNINTSVSALINEMKENGELDSAIMNSIGNFETRVTNLENTEYTLVYEEGTENLILQKTIKEVE